MNRQSLLRLLSELASLLDVPEIQQQQQQLPAQSSWGLLSQLRRLCLLSAAGGAGASDEEQQQQPGPWADGASSSHSTLAETSLPADVKAASNAGQSITFQWHRLHF